MITNDFISGELCEEAVVNEEAIQQVVELSQSQLAYSQSKEYLTLLLDVHRLF